MIFPMTEWSLEQCWFQCSQRLDCTWYSYSQSEELCWLMKYCSEKTNASEWISSNGDCYDPESKYNLKYL